MSMCCSISAVSAEQVQKLLENGEAFWELEGVQSFSVDTAWPAVHYLLTGTTSLSEPAPRGFLVDGGAPLDGTNGGYGEARLFAPAEVATIDAAIQAITEEQLLKRCEPPRQGEAPHKYPIAWDHEAIRSASLALLSDVQQFVTAAHQRGQALVVELT